MATLPRYPIYVISKGRHKLRHTSRFLELDGVPYHIVIEPQEYDAYSEVIDPEKILVLPFSNLGQGSIPARNWVWEHSVERGFARHWILDDNITRVYRLWYGERIPCDSGPAFAQIEDFVERYENIWVAGMNYKMFGLPNIQPYFTNTHVYSCMLIQNDIPIRWRGRYNEDTDLCLQTIVTHGMCTVLVNVFLADKLPTMTQKGGNTDELYAGDGRLEMARSLEEVWPGTVTVDRRFQRPQHVINWRSLKNDLKRKPEVDLDSMPKINEYGLEMIQRVEPKSEKIRAIHEAWASR